jgi:tetratricopeptide (TPR) repeat protein
LAYHWLSNIYLLLSRHREELASAEQALAYARQTDDPLIVAQVETRYGGALIRHGRIVEGCAKIDEHFPQFTRVSDSTDYSVVMWSIIEGYLALGEFSPVHRYVASAVEALEVTGDVAGIATVPWFQAQLAFFEGRWEEANAALAESCDLSQETGLPMYPYYLIFSSHLKYLCGAPEQARASQEHARTLLEQRPLVWFAWQSEAVLADQELLEGRPMAATSRLLALLEPLGVELHFNAFPLLPRLAQAYLDMGKVAAAETAANRAVERAADMKHRLVLVDALRVRALLAIQRHELEAATGALNEALDLARAMPYPYAEAKTLWVYGSLEVARGDPAAAHERFEQAKAICDRLGERMYAERIKRDLAALTARMN